MADFLREHGLACTVVTFRHMRTNLARRGAPGITEDRDPHGVPRLSYRDARGLLCGVLLFHEKPVIKDGVVIVPAGEMVVSVLPRYRRQGIATALTLEAMRRWPINLDKQRTTRIGRLLAAHVYCVAYLGGP